MEVAPHAAYACGTFSLDTLRKQRSQIHDCARRKLVPTAVIPSEARNLSSLDLGFATADPLAFSEVGYDTGLRV